MMPRETFLPYLIAIMWASFEIVTGSPGITEPPRQQATYQQRQEEMAHDDYQKELDRLSREKIAVIQATGFGKVESEDVDQNSIPDVLEMSKLTNDQDKATKDYQTKMADIASKNKQFNDKMAIEQEKIKIARENMANDLAVAKENAKGRNNKKL